MNFIHIILATYVLGCSEAQPRTRTQPLKNSGQTGTEDANGATKPTQQEVADNAGAGNSGGSASANDNSNMPQNPASNGASSGAGQANGLPMNNGGAGQPENNIVLVDTNPGANITDAPPVEPPPTDTSNTTTAPTPTQKPACPAMPNIQSPINSGDVACSDACRDKLRRAANYVNNLSTTKPKISIPNNNQLENKIVAQNLFALIKEKAQDSASAYATVCNPLAGKKYRP